MRDREGGPVEPQGGSVRYVLHERKGRGGTNSVETGDVGTLKSSSSLKLNSQHNISLFYHCFSSLSVDN